ncbi:MAG: hypothetical protein ABI475_00455 [Methylophilaceae bacterium]
MNSSVNKDDLKLAVTAALGGDWNQAHLIAQESDDRIGHWIHAVLHKIENDESNSRYWYARAHKDYEDFTDPAAELNAILQFLQNTSA